jgi:hypothetical protein
LIFRHVLHVRFKEKTRKKIRSVSLLGWYINITITILEIGVVLGVWVSGLPLGPLTRVYVALLSLDNYVVLLSMRPL